MPDITPEQFYSKNCSSLIEKDDFIQDCYLVMLENPDKDKESLFKFVLSKHNKEKNEKIFKQAPHIYNDDGECIDDDIYYIDKSTTEKYGEGRRIDDKSLEYGRKIVKCTIALTQMIKGIYRTETVKEKKENYIERLVKLKLKRHFVYASNQIKYNNNIALVLEKRRMYYEQRNR